MAGKQLSYDYVNDIRDMSNVFATIVQEDPILSALLSVSSNGFTNKKLERLDDVTSPLSRVMDQTHTSADGFIDVALTAGLEEGMVVQFDEVTTWSRSTLIAEVGAITTDDKFAITVYGGSTDEDITSGATVKLLSKPLNEATEASANTGYEPVAAFNYSQIFDRVAKLSRTAMNTGMYGINLTAWEVLNFQVEKQLRQIGYMIAASTINMPRVTRSSSAAGSMGGRFRFLQQQTGNSVAGGSASIDSAKLNQAFELSRLNGGNPQTIVANPVHAKYFSAMNQSNNNPVVTRSETTAGNYVANFVSDFGDQAKIVYSYNMDKDKIAITDPGLIRLRPMENSAFTDEDATPSGADYVQRRILWEYSLEVRNATEAHVYIDALTN